MLKITTEDLIEVIKNLPNPENFEINNIHRIAVLRQPTYTNSYIPEKVVEKDFMEFRISLFSDGKKRWELILYN